LDPPKQVTFVVPLIEAVSAGGGGGGGGGAPGSVMVMVLLSVQPAASCTLYVYEPAFTLVVGPVYVYVGVPPVADNVTVVLPPKLAIVPADTLSVSFVGSDTVALDVTVVLFASFTLTE
jgi:hypothetical protein